ncbi:MAG: sialate O-acetylesterase [Candidatus Marinimicrobia bacterium]|nr:sialate O-acetylesterase [Candidatus Neomarinimicrobiota bacterium]MCF7880608.1 sialate O-acetylesterase [Candidatus Neomarinimicrobiota bacterium]
MVLQRDTAVDIWGWASQGEEVTLHFIDSTYTTNADSEGRWQITLPKMRAGGPYTMEISGDNRLKIRDILIGDIWVCSGQSNMELNMQRVSPLYEDEIATAKYPEIRYFEVPDTYNFSGPQSDLPGGKWKKTTPDQVLNFSAVSYFFGKAIHEQYEIPVGLINSALGGSPAQAWISEEGLKQFPEYYNEAQRFKDSTLIQRIRREDQKRIDQWYQVLREKDRGYKNPTGPWYSSEFHPTNWSTMSIPGYWANESLGSVNGVVWFRKEVEVPASMANNPARLKLGRIIDADSTFVNGEFVGTTSYQYPPRRYAIPAGVLKEGTNVIVLRVINNRGRGGFAVDKPYKIIAAGDTIDLKGEWQYKLGARMEPLRGQTFIRWKPVGLYNAMIAPLLDFRIKGVIWYQGESNTSRPVEYRELFTSLIRDWRGHWHQETLPFLFVQLPNFMEANPQPTESNWALLRESQMKALSLPNTGMAVTIDIGEWNDIHPLNKKDVGDRLARVAQKVAYGNDDIVYSGPIYESLTKEGQKIILSFTHTGSGLVAIGDEALHGFAIAGPDKKFVWADAKIRGDQVVVWSEQVENPVAVRYAWADNPKDANLYNKEGLPAAPFRTDSWEGIEK